MKPTHNVQPQPPLGSDSSTPITQPHFISAYSQKIRSQLLFAEQGRTKQSFKDECDINIIMKRFAVTGELSHLSQAQPLWGDLPEIDFHGAMAVVVDARERFQTLPAELRDRFLNDPARLLAFVQDPANKEEGIKLGLFRKPEPAPSPTPQSAPPEPKLAQ
ncbi:MAG: internal scaffolding protein [Microviridae sp.]|nr:MAG: internal scaffolding protein [Microviridae sp.]